MNVALPLAARECCVDFSGREPKCTCRQRSGQGGASSASAGGRTSTDRDIWKNAQLSCARAVLAATNQVRRKRKSISVSDSGFKSETVTGFSVLELVLLQLSRFPSPPAQWQVMLLAFFFSCQMLCEVFYEGLI